MKFDKNSDVTIVLTSCDRFNLLAVTLKSLDDFNTYPIKKIILIEDSGNNHVCNAIPTAWARNVEIIINTQKLGQIKSIDKAYSLVDTKYIFHCEDDWQFYRSGFIEDSKLILESNENIIQVWLRNYNEDIRVHYPFHFLDGNFKLNDIVFSKLGTNNPKWRGFSFNPGLKRKEDYQKIAPYFVENQKSYKVESAISNKYHELGMYAVLLDKSAVKHIGWDNHVLSEEEKHNIKKRKTRKIKYLLIGFIMGVIFSFLLSLFIN